jgi:hypothetical protein
MAKSSQWKFDYWRVRAEELRAEELRAEAEQMAHSEAKRIVLQICQTYDRLADEETRPVRLLAERTQIKLDVGYAVSVSRHDL